MSVLAIIQARLGSTRFPRKALADLGGKPLIAHVLERVRRCVPTVVLAVPESDLSAFLWVPDVPVYAPGVDPNDVLARFVAVAALYPEHDTIMRVTGDCPLWDPAEGHLALFQYERLGGHHYVWNVTDGYVDGEDVEVFSRAMLLEAHWHAKDPADREHVTPYIRRRYPVATVMPDVKRSLKTSVDTPEDLERVRALYAA